MKGFLLKAIGVLLILAAIGVALSRAPDRPVETLVERWAPPPSEFVQVKGQVVHVRDEGPRSDPVPIVLIHGTGASLHTWDGWVKTLKTQRRVIRFDLPGFGLTGPFTGPPYIEMGYRGDNYARFVVDLLDQLKVPRVVLAGNSLGGEVAWRTAVFAPERVERLVLVDASGPRFTPESIPIGFVVARIPVINRLGEFLLPRAAVTRTLSNLYGDPTRVTPELVDRYFEITLREGNRRAMGERLAVLEEDLSPERIAQVRQPTLLLWGSRDRLIPPSTADFFTQSIPGSRVVVLRGLGHVPHEEDPAASLDAAKAFLDLR